MCEQMQLTCTKHKLYDLLVSICGAGGMPSFGKCTFKKAYRKRSWWMEWSTKRADFEVYFSTVAGEPVIVTTVRNYSRDGSVEKTMRYTRKVAVEVLKKYGMLECT